MGFNSVCRRITTNCRRLAFLFVVVFILPLIFVSCSPEQTADNVPTTNDATTISSNSSGTSASCGTCLGLTCTICGTSGNDTLNGTSGNDVICGLDGNDTISGGDGADKICGGVGADIMHGGSGNDVIWGFPGGDFIVGDGGTDDCNGGLGGDTCDCETVATCEG